MHTQENNWEKELRAIELGIAGWMRNVYGFTDGDTVSMEEVETVIRQFWNDQEPFIKRTRQEAYEKGRKDAREEALDWIENNPEFPTPRIYEVAKIMTFLQVSIRAASAPKQT